MRRAQRSAQGFGGDRRARRLVELIGLTPQTPNTRASARRQTARTRHSIDLKDAREVRRTFAGHHGLRDSRYSGGARRQFRFG